MPIPTRPEESMRTRSVPLPDKKTVWSPDVLPSSVPDADERNTPVAPPPLTVNPSPLEPATWQTEPGFVVPTPTLPSDFIVIAGVEKVEPPLAVEGVISKPLSTLVCAAICQLNLPVPLDGKKRCLTAEVPSRLIKVVSDAVTTPETLTSPLTSSFAIGVAVPMPTFPSLLSKIPVFKVFDPLYV